MRELTQKELQLIYKATCPLCGFHDPDATFRKGPQGGMSINVFCGRCGAGFNVMPVGLGGQLIKYPGAVEFAFGNATLDSYRKPKSWLKRLLLSKRERKGWP